jgi:hypothetical protein
MRPLVLLAVFLVAMPVDAQTPCVGPAAPDSLGVTALPRPAPDAAAGRQAPPAALLAQVCAQLDEMNRRLAAIEARQKAEADQKPTLVRMLNNRYVELVLVSVGSFFAGLKVR